MVTGQSDESILPSVVPLVVTGQSESVLPSVVPLVVSGHGSSCVTVVSLGELCPLP